jgi:hypothetical protein
MNKNHKAAEVTIFLLSVPTYNQSSVPPSDLQQTERYEFIQM